MKVEDYFDVLVSNRHVLQSPICFQDFSKGSLEGFVGLNQRLISQMAKCAFARDDVSADSGTIEGVYLDSLFGARIERGELIRSTSDDSSIFLNCLLLIVVVDFLTFSLQKAASMGYVEATGTSGLLLQT